MQRPLLIALILAAPALAGCFSDPAPETTGASVAANAQEAGAVAGPAPSAAKNPYQVQGEATGEATTIYPLAIHTNPPKAPYTKEFTGEYRAEQCTAGGQLPLVGILSRDAHNFDVAEAFVKDDVYSYEVSLTFTNTDQSWAELHLWHSFDGVGDYANEPVAEKRGEIITNFTGQGLIKSEEVWAFIGVDCWFGQITASIPYTIKLDVTFAEGAVPSSVPVLVTVPEGATRLYASGVPLDPDQPVQSHYRVFAPDDSLVCECALGSNEQLSEVELPGAGDYVVLVDHTANGFVSLALDAEPESRLIPLDSDWVTIELASSAGSGVDETLSIDLPSTPLNVFAWVTPPGNWESPPDAGLGHNLKIQVSNSRGDVLRVALAGYFTSRAGVPGLFGMQNWYAIPIDGEWEFFSDHHAYDVGQHTAHVSADQLRGTAVMFAELYQRPQ